MKKLPLLFSFSLLTTAICGQAYIGLSINQRGGGVQVGGLIKKVADVSIGLNTRIAGNAEQPTTFYANAGIRCKAIETDESLLTVTPALGIATTKFTDLSQEHIAPAYKITDIKETKINYSLEVGWQRSIVRWHATVSHSMRTWVSVGGKVFID